jgi:cysteine/O-acetylserine efflux protein
MNIEYLPLISFVIITTFSPGPNNIASASMGIVYGYKRTIKFLFGITTGFFVVMVCCAYLSSTLLRILPTSGQYLRWVGALYVIWLAIGMLKSNNSIEEAELVSMKKDIIGTKSQHAK